MSSLLSTAEARAMCLSVSDDGGHLDLDEVEEMEEDVLRSTEILFRANDQTYVFRLNLKRNPNGESSVMRASGEALVLKNPNARPGKRFKISPFPGTILGGTNPRELKKVGFVKAHLLPRPNQTFYPDADAENGELIKLACTFFNHNGTVCRVDHPELTGEARWHGGFFQIDTIETAHRGIDLGLHLLHELMLFLKDDWTLAVMQPGAMATKYCEFQVNRKRASRVNPFTGPTEKEMRETRDDSVRIQRHFARMGFVQTGRTRNLGQIFFVTKERYFSRALSPSEIPSTWLSKSDSSLLDLYAPPIPHIPSPIDHELQKAINLVVARQSLTERDRQQIQYYVQQGASIHRSRALFIAAGSFKDPTLFQFLVQMGGNVDEPDEHGNRPLHIAASSTNKEAAAALVDLGANANVRCEGGKTPADALLATRRDIDDFSAVFSLGRSRSHSFHAKEMENIHGTMMSIISRDIRKSLVDKWMSPRLLKMLQITAELELDSIREYSNNLRINQLTSLADCTGVFGIPRASYLPSTVMKCNPRGFYRSFNQGWGNAFEAILFVLNKGGCPNLLNVKQALCSITFATGDQSCNGHAHTNHFLSHGGKVEYAIDAVLTITKNVLCDGEDGWEYNMFEDEIERLPATPLDGLFQLARYMCLDKCGAAYFPQGPHNHEYFDDVDAEDL